MSLAAYDEPYQCNDLALFHEMGPEVNLHYFLSYLRHSMFRNFTSKIITMTDEISNRWLRIVPIKLYF